MASAKKCDRCGKYYETIDPHPLDVVSAAICKLSKALKPGVVKQIEENVDLCPQCVKSLIRWYKGNNSERREE